MWSVNMIISNQIFFLNLKTSKKSSFNATLNLSPCTILLENMMVEIPKYNGLISCYLDNISQCLSILTFWQSPPRYFWQNVKLFQSVNISPILFFPGPQITRCQCSDDVWPEDGVKRHPDPPAADGSR